ncbi:MAG TPA: hypothetical protein VGK48_19075 [Terriglobia bacterium]|jgi:hypothetical protein
MIRFLTQHQFGFAVAIYWIFSAAVSSMPEPAPDDAPGYRWLYRFVHSIAGNLTTAFSTAARYRACASPGSRLPVSKLLPLVLLVPMVWPATACVARYTVRPGALSAADSAAYDTLYIAESVIDQARSDSLSPPEKDALGTLIASYNVARASWLAYRGALATNTPPDEYFQQLTKNLTDLTNAIQALGESGKEVKK